MDYILSASMARHVSLVTCALAAALAASGWTAWAQSTSAWWGIYPVEQADRGRRLYVRDCAQCHGATLTGAEGGAELVGAAFLGRWEKKSVGELFELVRTTMPDESPGSLTERQYLDVLAYVLKENAFPAGKDELPRGLQALNALALAKP
jgi:mono/diheme cytochrome c family protein